MQKKAGQIEILNGWKEIANYLGKGVRTVQRYEGEMRLPVHRLGGKFNCPVVAKKADLDDWITSGPVRLGPMPKRRLTERTNRLGAKFLQIDSEIALTFCGIALVRGDEEKKRRTTQIAR